MFFITPSIYKNVVELNKLLKEIKICDPAVGSGAFPVGMMNEIIKARKILGYFLINLAERQKSDYDLKRETIENCLYGVDLMPSAVDICKLRFWLSLIVDEVDMKNIKPLPNLDNKIMCGNSLIEEFEGVKLFDKNLVLKLENKREKQTTLSKKNSDYKLETLQKLQKEFFNEESRDKKNKLREEIDKIEWEFIEITLKEQKNEEAIKKLNEYKSKPFFLWELYFSDVFNRKNPGFDVVIGNPPYIQLQDKTKISAHEQLAYQNQGYYTFQRTGDIYSLFYEKGLKILRKEGLLAYITSAKWLRTEYGKKTREYFISHANPKQIITFEGNQIFDSAIVDTNILLISNSMNKKETIGVKVSGLDKPLFKIIKERGILLRNLSEKEWFIGNKDEITIKEKI